MGRKRTRAWKYLFISAACMIFVILAGCATLKEMEAKRETRTYLTTAQKLFDQGDYEGSLRENQKAFSLSGNTPPGDEALFNMGLIYAHYGYPKRDYKKSLDLFKRLGKIFPQSPLAGQVKIWIGVIQENERLNGKIEGLNKTIEGLSQTIEGLNKTIEKSKQVDIELEEKKKELSK